MAKKSKSVKRVSSKRSSDGRNDPNRQFVKVFWFSLAIAALILAYLWFRGDNNVLGARTSCTGPKCAKQQEQTDRGNKTGITTDKNAKPETTNPGQRTGINPTLRQQGGGTFTITQKELPKTPITTTRFQKGLVSSFVDGFKGLFIKF